MLNSRGYSQNNWVRLCGPLPKGLTLIMTKFCDFLYPINDLIMTNKLDSLTVTAGTVALNIVYKGLC